MTQRSTEDKRWLPSVCLRSRMSAENTFCVPETGSDDKKIPKYRFIFPTAVWRGGNNKGVDTEDEESISATSCSDVAQNDLVVTFNLLLIVPVCLISRQMISAEHSYRQSPRFASGSSLGSEGGRGASSMQDWTSMISTKNPVAEASALTQRNSKNKMF